MLVRQVVLFVSSAMMDYRIDFLTGQTFLKKPSKPKNFSKYGHGLIQMPLSNPVKP
jgi:hypothetical protein